MSFRPPIGVRLKSSVLTRRDLQHSGSGLALNWPMCRDRHPGIPQVRSDLTPKCANSEVNCGLASLPRSRPGLWWQRGDPYWSGDSIPALLGLLGALGGRFGAIFLFWRCPPGSPLFSLLYPYSPGVAVLCCVLIFVPLCRILKTINMLLRTWSTTGRSDLGFSAPGSRMTTVQALAKDEIGPRGKNGEVRGI